MGEGWRDSSVIKGLVWKSHGAGYNPSTHIKQRGVVAHLESQH